MATKLAAEDVRLGSSSIIGSRTKVYKDIDLTFAAKPSGEIFKKTDAAAVKQAVKNLMLTNYFEKPFQPLFGANLRDMLFDLADEESEEHIVDALNSAPGVTLSYLGLIQKHKENDLKDVYLLS